MASRDALMTSLMVVRVFPHHVLQCSAYFLAEYGGRFQALDAGTYQASFPGYNVANKFTPSI
jgi:hypothetical protein